MARKSARLQADNLVQGISQQVPSRRSLNHAEDRLNIRPSIVHGNTKRPPTRFLSNMNIPAGVNRSQHNYKRDKAEAYSVVHSQGTIQVFAQADGAEQTVNFEGASAAYLTSTGTSRDTFRFLTLGDYTFVVNREVTVTMDPAASSAPDESYLIYLVQGDYGSEYTVTVNGNVASFTTSADLVAETSTSFIMQKLRVALDAALGGSFTITGDGSVIQISRAAGTTLEISVKDSIGNKALVALKEDAQSFDDLPDRAPHGYRVKITNSSGTDADDYYVKFTADDPSSPESSGVWVETKALGVDEEFTASTMPHALVREANGTFTFREHDWGKRGAGDASSNPEPTFVGQKINNLFFFENRLGFLSGANIITSRTASYFNFWRSSARTRLDTDPVDVAALAAGSSDLLYAYPFDGKLVVFGDNIQLISKGGGTYSPDTASLDVSSEYEFDVDTAPVVVGSSIFFLARAGDYMSLMEMPEAEGAGESTYARSVSDHVPTLVPHSRYTLVGSTQAKTLLLIPEDGATAYTYNWLFKGNEQVVSSWDKWALGDGGRIWDGFFDNAELHLSVGWRSMNRILTINPSGSGTFSGSLDDAHLDYMETPTVTYDAPTDLTTVSCVLPYVEFTLLGLNPEGYINDLEFRIRSTGTNGGGGTLLTVAGEYTDVRIGVPFETINQFSAPFPLRYGPRGELVADLTRRFQLTALYLNLTDTGPFEVRLTRPGRPDRTEFYNGKRVGDPLSIIGRPAISSGSFKVGLGMKNSELNATLWSKSWMPLCFTAGEWTGSQMRRTV